MGKGLGSVHCKYMDPDGDFTLLEWRRRGAKQEGPWSYLYGSGKWKGIKGGGKGKTVTAGKAITKGTIQTCIHVTGSFEVPKK